VNHFVRPGDFCVDVGASIGYFTCLFSQLVGPDGVVLAFEPNERSFGYLVENIAARGLKNVSAHRLALWKEDLEAMRLHSVDRLGYTSVLKYHTTTYTEVVKARTLDSILLDLGFQPNFIKIDCEMAEHEILEGASAVLTAGVDCVVLEFNYYLMAQCGLSDKIIREFMHDLGYDMFLVSVFGPEKAYMDPMMIDPRTEIRVVGELKHINVMFSTEEKVRDRWKICDTSKSLRQSAENYKDSLLNITAGATA